MSVKTIPHPATGRTFKLGRRRPPPGRMRIHLRNYTLPAGLPPPPASCDYGAAAMPVLNDVMGNDRLGDCTCAGAYHIVGVETGNAGALFHATTEQVVADYSAIGGYVQGDESTDNGCDEEQCLAYWRNTGFADGTKLAGYVALDPSDTDEVKTAIYLFENCYFGCELPEKWCDDMPAASGFVWDVAGDPVPENGHCFIGYGFTQSGILVDTWGLTGTVTWGAVRKYCAASAGGALYVMLTLDQLARGASIAPNGIQWSQLVNDFNTLGGTVPAATPQPQATA